MEATHGKGTKMKKCGPRDPPSALDCPPRPARHRKQTEYKLSSVCYLHLAQSRQNAILLTLLMLPKRCRLLEVRKQPAPHRALVLLQSLELRGAEPSTRILTGLHLVLVTIRDVKA
jgi:hypothetical protein